MIYFSLTLYFGIALFSFLIGRFKKQDAYERRIKELEADKEYWHEIALRQKQTPEPPGL